MLKLKNYQDGGVTVDRLNSTADAFKSGSGHCTEKVCLGSLITFPTTRTGQATTRPKDQIKAMAKDFFDQYYASIKRFSRLSSQEERWVQVVQEIDARGTYDLTEAELAYGAKLAWRNSSRCVGRIQWSKLQVFDARDVTTTAGMFDALCTHLKYATNGGNIRSAITVFPQRTDGKHDFRVWNPQLIAYAGYRNPDGTITGDSNGVEFTEVCTNLGWKGKGTKFDVLPWVFSANGQDPDYFEIPPELVLQVDLIHPHFDWFKELGLQWYCVPAVSNMLFECAGLEFPAAPFNGWYMSTEIGCRNLSDSHRYNYLEEVATRMGLDTRNPTTLWKDKALVEINLAVLYSFQSATVTIVDHHTACESFMKHCENEQRLRGGCPADWVWIVPPMSGSVTPVFHQEMALYHLKPNYDYQEVAWKTHVWQSSANAEDDTDSGLKPKRTFKDVAKAIQFTTQFYTKALSKRVKATILYATETGKSEMFARKLADLFALSFNAKVYCMEDYDTANLEHESLVVVVASTFGNGDPPENGESFASTLHALKAEQSYAPALAEQTSAPAVAGQTSAPAVAVPTRRTNPVSRDRPKSFIKLNSKANSITLLIQKFNNVTSLKSPPLKEVAPFATPAPQDTFGPLKNITFAVFALGSTAYPNYCAFGHYVDNLFGELGGERLLKMATGDELAGQDQAFKEWTQEIYPRACKSFCLDVQNADTLSANDTEHTPTSSTTRFKSVIAADEQVQALSKTHNRKVAMYSCKQNSDLLQKGTGRSTINIVLETSVGLAYSPGDHVGIMPENRTELVNTILARLTGKPSHDDAPVQLELLREKKTQNGVQEEWNPHRRLPRASLRTILARYLDITAPPRSDILAYFAQCTTDESHRSRLNSLATDQDEYDHWKQWNWPHLVTVLEEFPSVTPDAGVLCAMLPLLQPRYYSVSSSPLAYPNELHLTVAVVTYNTRKGDGPLHYGVCSNYLNDLKPGTLVPCFVRRAAGFYLPEDMTKPIVMIGPGTGIAPFRGFWQHRTQIKNDKPATKFGTMILYFGCRTKGMMLYQDEVEQLKQNGILSESHVALSREPETPKVYVQDLLVKEGGNIFHYLSKEEGHIYVCGDCTMAEEVYKTLNKILQDRGDMTEAQSEAFMLSLRDANRYHEDIFGITHRTAEVHNGVREAALTRVNRKSQLLA